jgi:hypothetical protein
MAASTYTKESNLAQRGKLISLCPTTAYVALSTLANGVFLGSTNTSTDANTMRLPGGVCSTICGDILRFPVQKEDSKMAFYIAMDAAVIASSWSYPAVAVRIPYHGSTIQDNSPAFGASYTVGCSTVNSGWKVFYSTAITLATSTECEAFLFGPIESGKYAMNFGGTSTSGIDANQNYFEMMVGLTTAIGVGTYLAMSTTTLSGANPKIVVVPIELP